MDLDTLIITWFCKIDEGIKKMVGNHRLRQRGPDPTLVDSEALTMEVVGEHLQRVWRRDAHAPGLFFAEFDVLTLARLA
jgi:hypothetical protein